MVRDKGGSNRVITFLLALSFALLLCFSMVLAIGCTGSERPGEDAAQGTEEEQELADSQSSDQESDDGQEPAPHENGDELPSEGGYTEFSLERQEIGEDSPFEWVKISDVSWTDEGDYIRFVFAMERQDGSDLVHVPNVAVTTVEVPEEELYQVCIWFISVRPSTGIGDPRFVEAEVPAPLGDPVVETIERLATGEGEGSGFAVRCAYSPAHPGVSSRPRRLTYLTDPMRVIVDIQKM